MSNDTEKFIESKCVSFIVKTGIALVLAYIIIALFMSLWPFNVASRVLTPAAIIQNYEWYHDQYNAIKAQYANILILPEGSQERTGAAMVLNRAIGEYNSRASQISRNMWKSNALPHQITLENLK